MLRKLGLRNVNLPKELKQKVEKDRESLSPRLRGSKLDQWIEKWIDDNLDQKQKMTQGSLITSRFKQGRLATPLWVIDRMFTIRDHVFPSQEALDQWLQEQKFPPEIRERISQDVPPTKEWQMMSFSPLTYKLAKNLEDHFIGSTLRQIILFHTLFCGQQNLCSWRRSTILRGIRRWEITMGMPTRNRGNRKLPLFHNGKVFVLANTLRAFDGKTGQQIWENNSVKGKTASPMIWKNQWQTALVCNSSKTIFCINPNTGETLWEGPGAERRLRQVKKIIW